VSTSTTSQLSLGAIVAAQYGRQLEGNAIVVVIVGIVAAVAVAAVASHPIAPSDEPTVS
jgi:hypothetical protein